MSQISRTDIERLNWMERNEATIERFEDGFCVVWSHGTTNKKAYTEGHPTIREAIDAAMATGKERQE